MRRDHLIRVVVPVDILEVARVKLDVDLAVSDLFVLCFVYFHFHGHIVFDDCMKHIFAIVSTYRFLRGADPLDDRVDGLALVKRRRSAASANKWLVLVVLLAMALQDSSHWH